MQESMLVSQVKELTQQLDYLQGKLQDAQHQRDASHPINEEASWSTGSHLTAEASHASTSTAVHSHSSSRRGSSAGGASMGGSSTGGMHPMETINEDVDDAPSQVQGSQTSGNLSAALAAASLTKMDRVVAIWKDVVAAKDQQISSMQQELVSTSSQLEHVREELASTSAQV